MELLILTKAFFCLIAVLLGNNITLYWAGLFGLFGHARVLGLGRIGGLVWGAHVKALWRVLPGLALIALSGAAVLALTKDNAREAALFVTLMIVFVILARAAAVGAFDQIAEAGGPTTHRHARLIGGLIGLIAGAMAVEVLFLMG